MIHFSVKNTYAQAIIFNSFFHVKQNWSPLIYPLKSPVFIGGSGDEWLKSPLITLHHPSIMQGINAEPLTKSGKRNSVWLSC